jgi:hypothetical protein
LGLPPFSGLRWIFPDTFSKPLRWTSIRCRTCPDSPSAPVDTETVARSDVYDHSPSGRGDEILELASVESVEPFATDDLQHDHLSPAIPIDTVIVTNVQPFFETRSPGISARTFEDMQSTSWAQDAVDLLEG